MKPATPLPWGTIALDWRSNDLGAVSAGIQTPNEPPHFVSQDSMSLDPAQDAAYIVHAANAYPVLVAALQALVKAEEAYGDETNVAVNHEWLRAREVLRDLGEL